LFRVAAAIEASQSCLLDVVTGSRGEPYFDGSFLGATENHQLDVVACRLERLEQIVDATNGFAGRPHDQVAGCQPGTRCWTVVLHKANQQTLSIRQTDGASQPSGNVGRRYSDTKPNAPFRLTLGQGVHPSSEGIVGWDR
jgi:hypothetical protein